MNRTPRFYHSGETTDLSFVLDRLLAEFPESPFFLAGVSLGGNVLLKFLGERGAVLSTRIVGAAAVSVPYDLASSARRIDRGFSRVYQAHFLRSLRRKAAQKQATFPDRLPPAALTHARTIYAFDDGVTAPLHGFVDADDYYSQSSAIRWIPDITVPTLLLSAVDDPFLPADVLAHVRIVAAANSALCVEFVEHGGHVGFIGGRVPWRPIYYLERRLGEFFAQQLTASRATGAV
jgi:predicted alpha/beta-fold hydrolase